MAFPWRLEIKVNSRVRGPHYFAQGHFRVLMKFLLLTCFWQIHFFNQTCVEIKIKWLAPRIEIFLPWKYDLEWWDFSLPRANDIAPNTSCLSSLWSSWSWSLAIGRGRWASQTASPPAPSLLSPWPKKKCHGCETCRWLHFNVLLLDSAWGLCNTNECGVLPVCLWTFWKALHANMFYTYANNLCEAETAELSYKLQTLILKLVI